MGLEETLTFSLLIALSFMMCVWFVAMMCQFRRRHTPPIVPLQVTDTIVRVFVYNEDIETPPPPQQCCICADLPANVRLQPCNHRGICYDCAMRIWSYDSRCPFCRVHFTGLWFQHMIE